MRTCFSVLVIMAVSFSVFTNGRTDVPAVSGAGESKASRIDNDTELPEAGSSEYHGSSVFKDYTSRDPDYSLTYRDGEYPPNWTAWLEGDFPRYQDWGHDRTSETIDFLFNHKDNMLEIGVPAEQNTSGHPSFLPEAGTRPVKREKSAVFFSDLMSCSALSPSERGSITSTEWRLPPVPFTWQGIRTDTLNLDIPNSEYWPVLPPRPSFPINIILLNCWFQRIRSPECKWFRYL